MSPFRVDIDNNFGAGIQVTQINPAQGGGVEPIGDNDFGIAALNVFGVGRAASRQMIVNSGKHVRQFT